MEAVKIQTFSIICGTSACNARCPYCVSKMTPAEGVDTALQPLNWRNLEQANRYARDSGVSTVLLTGKGEPTLYPERISKVLEHLESHRYPFVELQTNGIALSSDPQKYEPFLSRWYELGLTVVALSVVHHAPERNSEIFLPHRREYIDLPGLIGRLHDIGFTVRLSAVMVRGYVDGPTPLEELADFARENSVAQLSVRPVARPAESRDEAVLEWVRQHELSKPEVEALRGYLDKEGKLLLQHVHGALVYDLRGQNICLTNALTYDPDPENIRQLIFFPDGHLRYDWQYRGAVLL